MCNFFKSPEARPLFESLLPSVLPLVVQERLHYFSLYLQLENAEPVLLRGHKSNLHAVFHFSERYFVEVDAPSSSLRPNAVVVCIPSQESALLAMEDLRNFHSQLPMPPNLPSVASDELTVQCGGRRMPLANARLSGLGRDCLDFSEFADLLFPNTANGRPDENELAQFVEDYLAPGEKATTARLRKVFAAAPYGWSADQLWMFRHAGEYAATASLIAQGALWDRSQTVTRASDLASRDRRRRLSPSDLRFIKKYLRGFASLGSLEGESCLAWLRVAELQLEFDEYSQRLGDEAFAMLADKLRFLSPCKHDSWQTDDRSFPTRDAIRAAVTAANEQLREHFRTMAEGLDRVARMSQEDRTLLDSVKSQLKKSEDLSKTNDEDLSKTNDMALYNTLCELKQRYPDYEKPGSDGVYYDARAFIWGGEQYRELSPKMLEALNELHREFLRSELPVAKSVLRTRLRYTNDSGLRKIFEVRRDDGKSYHEVFAKCITETPKTWELKKPTKRRNPP